MARFSRGALSAEEVAELQPLLLQFARFASQSIAQCRCTVRVSLGPGVLHTLITSDTAAAAPRDYAVDTRMAEWVMRTQEPLLVSDVGADTRFRAAEQRASGSAFCVPIATRNVLYGTLNAWHPGPDALDDRALKTLETTAAGMARAIERVQGRARGEADRHRASLLLALTRAVATPEAPLQSLDTVMPHLLEAISCEVAALVFVGEDDAPETHLYARSAAVVPEQARLRAWAERAQGEERERAAKGHIAHAYTDTVGPWHVCAVPLRMGETFLGLVCYFRPTPFDSDLRETLEECNHAIGVTVYNRRLLRQTHSREGRFEAVFAQATDGLLLLDESGTIALDANEAFYQMLHIAPETVAFPIPLAALERHWQDSLSEAGELDPALSGHWLIHANEVRERFLEMTESPVRVGDVLHRLRAFHDLSEARRTDQARVEFMNLVSHELRNPVASVYGYLDMLTDADAGPLTPFQRRCVESAAFGARQLWRLVDDITDLLQADLGRLMLDRKAADIERVVRESVDALRPLLIGKRLTATVEATGPIPPTFADPIRVQQIVINLLKNAVKFSPPDAPITVTLGVVGEGIEVRVTDRGPGVAAEDAERIFRRHERGPQPAQQDTSGLGLGLAVVQQLVLSHGGRVWVESTPGAGSTFAFTLPIVAE